MCGRVRGLGAREGEGGQGEGKEGGTGFGSESYNVRDLI